MINNWVQTLVIMNEKDEQREFILESNNINVPKGKFVKVYYLPYTKEQVPDPITQKLQCNKFVMGSGTNVILMEGKAI